MHTMMLVVLLFVCFTFSYEQNFDSYRHKLNTESGKPVDWKLEKERHKKREQEQEDPYNIAFSDEGDYTRISFDSLIYKGNKPMIPRRYMLVNNLPENCNGLENLPYGVFLTGFGATPENYSIGFPNITAMISEGEMCCFYAFMPFFAYFPFGGFWYTNNQFSVPENYLFLEVISVIEHAMKSKVTTDPARRALVGHSMGGYGAVMNSMRTNMEFFGQTCGINGGLYIWNLPEFQDSIHDKVLNESITRKETIFKDCNYTQPPYRYYADELNFNTQIAMSLASVFHSDGTTKPKPNSPYYFFAQVNPDCSKYQQTFGFNFWLDENGERLNNLFNVAPWNSPEGFLQANYPTLQKSMSGNLFLSITYQDEIVDYKENVVFSERLTARGINHTLYLYDGKHRDPFPGIVQCFKTFENRMCMQPTPAPTSDKGTTIPTWVFWFLLAVIGLQTIVLLSFMAYKLYQHFNGKNDGYTPL